MSLEHGSRNPAILLPFALILMYPIFDSRNCFKPWELSQTDLTLSSNFSRYPSVWLQFKMRYYEQRYPEVDELVMVQVRQIADMGAYVKLVHHFLWGISASFYSLRSQSPSSNMITSRE